MDKVTVLRLNRDRHTYKWLRLPSDGRTAKDEKTHRGILTKRANPIMGRTRRAFWPSSFRFFLWQHGDGDPLDLSASKNYQDATRKMTQEEEDAHKTESLGDTITWMENQPMVYSLARMGMTMGLIVVLAVLIAFLVLFLRTGSVDFSQFAPNSPAFLVLPFLLGAVATAGKQRTPIPERFGWRWIWEAAQVEARVGLGLYLALGAFVLTVLGFALAGAATANVAAGGVMLGLGLLAGAGIAGPIFVVLATPKLKIPHLDLLPGENEAKLGWVHPRKKQEESAALFFQDEDHSGQWLMVTVNGTAAFGGREKPSDVSDQVVYNDQDHTEYREEMKPHRIPWEKIDSWLIIAILGLGFFFLIAIWQEIQKAG